MPNRSKRMDFVDHEKIKPLENRTKGKECRTEGPFYHLSTYKYESKSPHSGAVRTIQLESIGSGQASRQTKRFSSGSCPPRPRSGNQPD
jgi:hypothetical protein